MRWDKEMPVSIAHIKVRVGLMRKKKGVDTADWRR